MRGLLPAEQASCMGVSPFKIHNTAGTPSCIGRSATVHADAGKSERPEAVALRRLLLTGDRKNEVLKARWEHIRLDLRLLVVPLSNSGKPRHISAVGQAVTVLHAMPRTPGDGCSPAMFRESRFPISLCSGTRSGGNRSFPMCAFTICGILSPVSRECRAFTVRGTKCGDTAILEPL